MSSDPLRPEPTCERCGQDLDWQNCWNCEDGFLGSDCIDDLCHGNDECIHGDAGRIRCDVCKGDGGYFMCWNCRPDVES